MDERTKENLAIAIAAGFATFIITYLTAQYITPGLKKVIK